MTSVVASAPGKVVLSGEYAVLHGAPAVCMAVNRRAIAKVTSVDQRWHSVTAPGFANIEGRFVLEDSAPAWLQGEREFRIVDAAWRTLGPPGDPCLSIELDTRPFLNAEHGAKFGLGSSAALTVALTAALVQSSDVLRDARRIHRKLQSGAGSGVDVAASACGGLIAYRMRDAEIVPLRWPEELAYRLIWSGIPASTPDKLERFRSQGHRRSLDALVGAAERMVGAWQSAAEVLARLPDYVEALREFDEDYALGIFDAGHDTLVAKAHSAGLVYKPCGAGGGDVGILLGTSDEHLDEFLAANLPLRCRVLESRLETQGVAWERH